MAEILHHLGCIKPCKYWDKLPINWCKISAINSTSYKWSIGVTINRLVNGIKWVTRVITLISGNITLLKTVGGSSSFIGF